MKRIILAALVGVLVSGPAWGAEDKKTPLRCEQDKSNKENTAPKIFFLSEGIKKSGKSKGKSTFLMSTRPRENSRDDRHCSAFQLTSRSIETTSTRDYLSVRCRETGKPGACNYPKKFVLSLKLDRYTGEMVAKYWAKLGKKKGELNPMPYAFLETPSVSIKYKCSQRKF